MSRNVFQIYIKDKDRHLLDLAQKVLGVRSASAAVIEALKIAINTVKGMSPDEFAQHLGYANWNFMQQASEEVKTVNDVVWYITRLPDGRWAAWDDSKLSPDRIHNTDTREQAIEFIQGGRSNENNNAETGEVSSRKLVRTLDVEDIREKEAWGQ